MEDYDEYSCMGRIFRAGPKKVIHVNMHIIRRNAKEGRSEPPITVKVKGKSYRGREVEAKQGLTFMYSPDEPLLSCGARLIAVTTGEVVVRQTLTKKVKKVRALCD